MQIQKIPGLGKKMPISAHFWLGGPTPVLGSQIIFHVISCNRRLVCCCSKCTFSLWGVPGGWGAAPLSCWHTTSPSNLPGWGSLRCSPLPELVSRRGQSGAGSMVSPWELSQGTGQGQDPFHRGQVLEMERLWGERGFLEQQCPPCPLRNGPRVIRVATGRCWGPFPLGLSQQGTASQWGLSHQVWGRVTHLG